MIFSNAEEILSINTKLLGKLQAKGEPIAKLARVFLEVGTGSSSSALLYSTLLTKSTLRCSRWVPSSTSTYATATATSLALRCCRRAGSRTYPYPYHYPHPYPYTTPTPKQVQARRQQSGEVDHWFEQQRRETKVKNQVLRVG